MCERSAEIGRQANPNPPDNDDFRLYINESIFFSFCRLQKQMTLNEAARALQRSKVDRVNSMNKSLKWKCEQLEIQLLIAQEKRIDLAERKVRAQQFLSQNCASQKVTAKMIATLKYDLTKRFRQFENKRQLISGVWSFAVNTARAVSVW